MELCSPILEEKTGQVGTEGTTQGYMRMILRFFGPGGVRLPGTIVFERELTLWYTLSTQCFSSMEP